jgi:hypothetical protein
LSETFPPGEYKNWHICKTLFLHVETIIGYKYTDRVNSLRQAKVFYNSALFLHTKGYDNAAKEMIAKALRIRIQFLGRQDANLIATRLLHNALDGRSSMEAIKDAESLLTESQSIFRSGNIATIVALNNHARLMIHRGDLSIGEHHLRLAIDAITYRFGPEYPDTLLLVNNLA